MTKSDNNNDKRKFFITGADGRTGYYLYTELHKLGHVVYGVDNKLARQGSDKKKKFSQCSNGLESDFECLDISRMDFLTAYFESGLLDDLTDVIHCATVTHDMWKYSKVMTEQNALVNDFIGTYNLFMCVSEYYSDARVYVFTGWKGWKNSVPCYLYLEFMKNLKDKSMLKVRTNWWVSSYYSLFQCLNVKVK